MEKNLLSRLMLGALLAFACAMCVPALAFADGELSDGEGVVQDRDGENAENPQEVTDGTPEETADKTPADSISENSDPNVSEQLPAVTEPDTDPGETTESTGSDVKEPVEEDVKSEPAEQIAELAETEAERASEPQKTSPLPEGAVLYTVKYEPAIAPQATAAKTTTTAKAATKTTTLAKAPSTAPAFQLKVQAHVQNIGWMDPRTVDAGKGLIQVGTHGRSLRVEELWLTLLNLPKGVTGGIQAQAHVQNVGWQAVGSAWGSGKTAKTGTHGKSQRIEAFRFVLTGDISEWYDIKYRGHVQNIGWQDWVKNGQIAGTSGRSLRVEAVEFKLEKKSKQTSPTEGIVGIRAKAHVQNVGWQAWVQNGSMAGTSGRSLRVEELRLGLDSGMYANSAISIKAHVQNIGDMKSKSGKDVTAGTHGRSLRMEAVWISLSGDIAKKYDVAYRAHVQNVGWQPWVVNGAKAGTSGKSLRVEALEIKLMKKGSSQTLSQGTYLISLMGSSSTLQNTNLTKGAQTTTGSYSQSSMAERYYVWKNSDKTLSLQSVGSGMFLTGEKGKLVQRPETSATAKTSHWTLTWNGGYQLTNKAGEKVSLSGKNAIVGKTAKSFSFSSTNLLPDGVYTAANAAKSKYLNLSGSEPYATGAKLTVANSGGGDRQKFRLSSLGGNVYGIASARSTLPVEVYQGSIVRTSYPKGESIQKWKVTFERSGGFVFTNQSNGKVMTAGAGGANGGAVTTQKKNGSAATQHWLLTQTSYAGNPAVSRAYEMIKNRGSSTNYMIAVDLSNHWLTVFYWSGGRWTHYRDWIVSNGKLSTPTVTGDYETQAQGYSFGHGYTCYYYTQFYGDYLFHSIKYEEGTFDIEDGRLGKYVSMGCVRMMIENAKWIYDNIPAGTHVRVYN